MVSTDSQMSPWQDEVAQAFFGDQGSPTSPTKQVEVGVNPTYVEELA